MKSIGTNLIKGLWNGISDAASWLYDKISGFVDDCLDKIKSFFGIGSPSKETAWMGEMLTEGLADGINDSADTAIDATKELSAGVLGAMEGLSGEMGDVIPDSFDINANANVASALSGTTNGGMFTGATFGSLISVEQMSVRSDDDVKKISEELYSMIQTSSRAQGRFAIG